MAVCSGCGQLNPELARFCLACAAPLAARTPIGRDVRKRITVVLSDVACSIRASSSVLVAEPSGTVREVTLDRQKLKERIDELYRSEHDEMGERGTGATTACSTTARSCSTIVMVAVVRQPGFVHAAWRGTTSRGAGPS